MMNRSDTFDLRTGSYEESWKHYLIANRVSTSESVLAADKSSHSDSSDSSILYLDSELSELLDVSPYIVRVHEGDRLLEQFEHYAMTQKGWSGIVLSISENHSLDELLAHLHRRLLVSFSSGRKGVLHFSNPHVANYFFGETADSDATDAWLGLIRQVCWYGPENSSNQGLWCSIQNNSALADLDIGPATSSWLITPSQERALKLKNIDKALAEYFSSKSIPFESRQQWLLFRGFYNEAMTLGIVELDSIYHYLSLCHEHSCIKETLESSAKVSAIQADNPDNRLIERLDIDVIQTLSDVEKIRHIERLLKKDRSYVNG